MSQLKSKCPYCGRLTVKDIETCKGCGAPQQVETPTGTNFNPAVMAHLAGLIAGAYLILKR